MQFAVIGNPISHSLSPLLHNSAFKALKIKGYYGRYCLDTHENFSTLISLKLKGANITIPYKETAFLHCDEVFGIAKEIQAVNTLVFKDNKLLGYNTDALGFYQCIEKFNFKNALILGAGGSAKAVACILKDKGISTTILNRSKERLESFLALGFQCSTYDNFSKQESYDIIINTTPSGLIQNSLPLEESKLKLLLKDSKLAFDLVYGIQTPFLNLAKNLHIPTQDGKMMLINQAILSFEIFMDSLKIAYCKNTLINSMQNAL